MTTPVECLLQVVAIGGRLGIAGENNLRMLLPPDCPQELKDAIRRHKVALLKLVRLNFLIVHSNTVNATVFWTLDDATRNFLANAGAPLGSIYTTAELEQLTCHRVTTGQLPLIHAAKYRFSGKVTNL